MTLPDPAARDLRDTEEFARTQRFFDALYAPAFGEVSNATTPSARQDGGAIAFAGAVMTSLEAGPARTRLCVADEDGVRRLTTGDAEEKAPQFSPDQKVIAYTSDRGRLGVQQLEILDLATGESDPTPFIDGTVEYLSWSPSGTHALLGIAGLAADRSGGEGSGGVTHASTDGDVWLPEVSAGVTADEWRSAWVYDLANDTVKRVSPGGLNVWEVVWAGPDAILAVASETPDEGAWYTATLRQIPLESGDMQTVYAGDRQLGWPAASPSGRRRAVVQARCSDRWVVAGDVVLLGEEGAASERVDTLDVDVTHLQWLDEDRLAFIGLRGLHTVAGVHDVSTSSTSELWVGSSTTGDRYPVASFLADGSAAVVHQAYDTYPELAWLRGGEVEVVASLRHAGADQLAAHAGQARPVRWQAPDGWEIEGIVCTPDGPGPHPLVVYVHGGPVWAYRSRWSMGHYLTPLLVSRGYAVLHPNPRGSSGHGQEFAEAVFGDMGGVDTHDFISGIDHLVAEGTIDPARVGVTGQSYGGFMSSWLVTQDQRFAAAVPMAPVTNWYSQHNTSNIPYFDEIFLAADPRAAGGRYHERSPVMFADRVTTPVLQTTGLDDRCTPPTQATEFHQALLEAGTPSVCVIYPGEGHGIRAFPAIVDHSTRVVDWFERHMPSLTSSKETS